MLEYFYKFKESDDGKLHAILDADIGGCDDSTPLEWEDLILSSSFIGITGPAYLKDKSNWVSVMGTIKKNTRPLNGDVLGILPEGFRPKRSVHTALLQGGSSWSDYIVIYPDGTIKMNHDTSPTNYIANGAIALNVVFKAEQ